MNAWGTVLFPGFLLVYFFLKTKICFCWQQRVCEYKDKVAAICVIIAPPFVRGNSKTVGAGTKVHNLDDQSHTGVTNTWNKLSASAP